jgi:hypothetical protein
MSRLLPVLLALLAGTSAASASLTINSLGFNGLTNNGLTSNALTSNALTSNSLTINGQSNLPTVPVQGILLPDGTALTLPR